jgi:hypothetical protein
MIIESFNNIVLIKFGAAFDIIKLIFPDAIISDCLTSRIHSKCRTSFFGVISNTSNVTIWTRQNHCLHVERYWLALNARITQICNRVVTIVSWHLNWINCHTCLVSLQYWVHEHTQEDEENGQRKKCSSVGYKPKSIDAVWVLAGHIRKIKQFLFLVPHLHPECFFDEWIRFAGNFFFKTLN